MHELGIASHRQRPGKKKGAEAKANSPRRAGLPTATGPTAAWRVLSFHLHRSRANSKFILRSSLRSLNEVTSSATETPSPLRTYYSYDLVSISHVL
jgi:hypothetical protein